MADKIAEIVDRAIEHTRAILDASRGEWSVARKGLERIRAHLANGAPEHPALDRLSAFIADQDRIRGDR